MRAILKKARQDAGLTQQRMAEYLNVSLRHYKYMESGNIVGSVELWDKLEDLFNIHQRKLREIEATHPDREDSQ
ncbi:MAG: helix-turn-helix transcriptional regulator [Firmicutes bacterium]|jgi:ribosome-binding protein aMBF1 (putative translation factor)|nr:helix-turn-helix transcriptional regulator [Bacillota bacterium]